MAKKKVEVVAADAGPVEIKPRVPTDWTALMIKVASDHWRTLRVKIQMRDKLMAGKPSQLDAAKAQINARGLGDVLEARQDAITDPVEREAMAEIVKDEGLCEFHRRPGQPGLWFPTNNIKAGFKENWSVLGFRKEFAGSRQGVAEGSFVFSVPQPGQNPAERDWIHLGATPSGMWTDPASEFEAARVAAEAKAAAEAAGMSPEAVAFKSSVTPDGTYLGVAHTMGMKGPQSSIKRHEYVLQTIIEFDIAIAVAIRGKLPDEAIARTILHFGEHGLGACRSQGFGRFDLLKISELPPGSGPTLPKLQ